MGKGLAEVFFPLLRWVWNIAVLSHFKTGLRLLCVKEKNPFKLGEGYFSGRIDLYSLFKFMHYIYLSFILSAYAKKERQSVAGCHESPCLSEPLKFQPLLCRGVPLFEASFSCQCFVQDGEWAFGMAQWWGRVHLGSNDRLECTSAASEVTYGRTDAAFRIKVSFNDI